MSDLTAQDKRDLSQMLGRTWGAVLTAGILTLGLGLVVLIWPDETVVVVSWLLGAYLIISGVFQLVRPSPVTARVGSGRCWRSAACCHWSWASSPSGRSRTPWSCSRSSSASPG